MVIESLIAWPPVGGWPGAVRHPGVGELVPVSRLDLSPGGRLMLGSSLILGPQGPAFDVGLWSVRSWWRVLQNSAILTLCGGESPLGRRIPVEAEGVGGTLFLGKVELDVKWEVSCFLSS